VVRLGTEKGAGFIKEATKARGTTALFEPIHGTVALFNAPMVLLHMIIQVAVRPMRHPVPEDIPNGTRVGIMAVGGDAVRHHPGHCPRRAEEGLCRCRVACVTEAHIHQVAVTIDRPVEVLPCALHLDIRCRRISSCPPNCCVACADCCSAVRPPSSPSPVRPRVKLMPRCRNISARSRRLNL
jgi:hypothetical protein